MVSVCDNAKESCPVFPRPVKRIHVGFHDPHGEPLDSFIAVRDDIRARLVPGGSSMPWACEETLCLPNVK